MKIKCVKIDGLFNEFNHSTQFKRDSDILIIHGVNGVGKTVHLKMIRSAISGDLNYLQTITFKKFKIDFDDGQYIEITQSAGKKKEKILSITKKDLGGEIKKFAISELFDGKLLDEIDFAIPGSYHRHKNGWMSRRTQVEISPFEMMEIFPHLRSEILKAIRYNLNADQNSAITFIESTRLISKESTATPSKRASLAIDQDGENADSIKSRIEQCANQLIQIIKDALSIYTELSQRLDGEFPQKLVDISRKRKEAPNPKDVYNTLQVLNSQRQILIERALLPKDSSFINISEQETTSAVAALALYASHTNSKFQCLSDVSDKIGLFVEILNKRFNGKSIIVDQERGFSVSSDKNKDIPLTLLSSGEQNEIVMLFELIFLTAPNSLILIDEPEISLHIDWQDKFIRDLKSVLKSTNSQAIIATHSPTIVGDYAYLMTTIPSKK